MSRRKIAIIIFTAVAIISSFLILGSSLERQLISASYQLLENQNYLLLGNGKQTTPYQLTRSSPTKGANPQTIISIGKDPENVFQSSPPSPVDFAIILKNLHRLGQTKPTLATTLAWSDPDLISLTALDQQLDSFPTIATSVPLTRGPVGEPLPAAFRRASIPVSEVHGKTELLPIVNKLAIPDAILGKTTSLAGFSSIESETTTEFPPLIAKWNDRLVFSLAIIAAIQQADHPPSTPSVRVGEYIALSSHGPFIPIDEFGRLRFPTKNIHPITIIPAQNLIGADEALLANNKSHQVILSDDKPNSEMDFSQSITGTIAAVTNLSSPRNTKILRRNWMVDFAFLSLLILLLYPPNLPKQTVTITAHIIIIELYIIVSHFAAILAGNLLLPTIPAFIATVASLTYWFISQKVIQTIEKEKTADYLRLGKDNFYENPFCKDFELGTRNQKK